MKRVIYLLHRFPGITDTFIRREICSLQIAGADIRVISVWRPGEHQTTPDILAQWLPYTDFILPRSPLSILRAMFGLARRSPRQFLTTFRFALQTSRPGLRGLAYQLFYFIEAVLAAGVLRQVGAHHVHNHIGDQSGTVTMLAARLAGIGYSITFHGWPVFFDAKYSRIKRRYSARNLPVQLVIFVGAN